MIEKILCVEDGSVDIDDLKEQLKDNKDIAVIPYRNGAAKPELIKIHSQNVLTKNITEEDIDDTVTKVLNALYKFIMERCEPIETVYNDSDRLVLPTYRFRINYTGSKDEFMFNFADMLNKELSDNT